MCLLNHRKGGMVFYQIFLLSPLHCTCTVTGLWKYVRGYVSLKKYVRGCVSLMKYKSKDKAVDVNSNS